MSQVIVVKQGPGRAVIAAGLRGTKGEAGAQGDTGLPFQVDAQGLLANRSAFDAEAVGFSYLATDTGELYFREGAAGGWSAGVAFQGPAGDSAYQVAVANGFVGTEVEWLAALQGDTGAAGRGITSLAINVSGHLIVTYTDATQADLGLVVGADGAAGTNGTNGTDGRGIASMAIDGSNHLIITYDDTTTEDAGLIPGAGGSAAWGGITGTLADQTDLQTALNGKATSAQGVLADGAIQSTEKGSALGVATLDAAGLVPAAQLPSYVDDVLEFADLASLPGTGETGKIYVTLDDSRQYRWSGSAYVQLVASPGTTDNVPEGATNLYHTAARVRATLLTDLSLADATAIAATDSVLQALGKLAARLATAFARANHSGEQAISTVTGLQVALDGKALAMTARTISGTSGTLVPSDAGTLIICTSASAVTLTIQLESGGAWPAASVVHILQLGAGTVTVTDGSGITVNVFSGLTKALRGQYASAALIRAAADSFALSGMLGGTPA